MDLAGIDDPIEQWEAMTAVAKHADKGSWDSIWLYDHFHTIPHPSNEPTFECWSATAALSRDTSRVNIGQMVGCNGYRHPSLYAKISSTVDVASHGRLYAGIGAGWYEHEWKAYGFEWPTLKDRMGAFAEAVEIVHGMWTQDEFQFNGKYYHVDKPINEPKGVRKPHPSLWIGGGGENVTLKLVAKYGDAGNFGAGNPDVVREKIEILKRHCDSFGRDLSEIIKSTNVVWLPVEPGEDREREIDRARGGLDRETFDKWTFVGTADEMNAKVEQVLAAGADYVNFYVPGVAKNLELIDRAEQVAKQFA
jgi:F420-dependent oxidoreductase-like protein